MTSWFDETSDPNLFVEDVDTEPVSPDEEQSTSEVNSESTISEESESSSEETSENESEDDEVFVPVLVISTPSTVSVEKEEIKKIEEVVLEDERKFEISFTLAESVAQALVRKSLQEALDFIDENLFSGNEEFIFNKSSCNKTPLDRKGTLVFNEKLAKEIRDLGFNWPSNELFTESLGEEFLKKYLETWVRDPIWRHAVQVLPKHKLPMERIYNYAVVWFRSTRRMPIPKVTAKVHFKIVASNVPLDSVLPVVVTYSYEGHRVFHRSGSTCQLSTVILSKIMDNKLSELRKWLKFIERSEPNMKMRSTDINSNMNM